jgi:hypothetical protein
MQDARLRPLLAADSDHMLVVFVLRTGRMAQVQRPPRAKPTNIEALLWVCYLGNHFFLNRQSEAVNESIATKCMPEVVSDLSYDIKKMLELCPQVAS